MRTQSRIATTKQIRQLESEWIKHCGSSWGQVLMEIAGRATAQEVLSLWRENPGLVTVVCGRGNNGGDGMVVARYLYLWDIAVKVITVSRDAEAEAEAEPDVKMSSAEAQTNANILRNLGVEILSAGDNFDQELEEASLIVDAVFGTGLDRDVDGPFRRVIDGINRSGKHVVAIDIPSGVNSDTGKIMASAVRADKTVTFGYLKPGLLCHPGASLAGDLSLVDIGLPNLDGGQPLICLSTADHARALLPPRPSDSNKGTFGTVLAIAGSLGMSGAGLLATTSSLKTGAGLVLLATPKSLLSSLPPGEVIYIPIDETGDSSIGLKALPAITSKLETCSAVILGPGISMNEETVQFVHKFLQETLADSGKPCIIDADALNAIAKKPDGFPKDSGDKIVLTPHPKELSRLMEVSVQEIQADRISWALKAAEQFNCTIVLKGSRTVIASTDGEVFINPTGNPGMATAGAGDVLSGIIGALLAQGLVPIDAATLGVYIHGMAGDVAAGELGETGVVAGDIKDAIPYAIQALERGEMSVIERQIFALDAVAES